MGKLAAENTIGNGNAINTNSSNTAEKANAVWQKLLVMESKLDKVLEKYNVMIQGMSNIATFLNKLELEKALGTLGKNQANMIREISDIKEFLQHGKNSNISKSDNNNGSGNRDNDSTGQGNKRTIENVSMDRPPLGISLPEIITKTVNEIVTKVDNRPTTEEFTKRFFLANKQKFTDFESFDKAFRENWKATPNYTSVLALKYIKSFINTLWNNLQLQGKAKEVTKENPNGQVIDFDYLAKIMRLQRDQIVELFNKLSDYDNTYLDQDTGKFDNDDFDYIAKTHFGTDITKYTKFGEFMGYLLNWIKSK